MKRVGNAFSGILGGFILLGIGIFLLWWNEGNNVKNLKTTAEMDKIIVDVSSDKVNPSNEGKLIATHGKIINEQELTDDTFGVKIKTPIMKRIVEIYQWDEDSTTDDDGHTTYNYKKKWDSDLIDSSDFHDKNKKNPNHKEYEDQTKMSTDVKVGAFTLSSKQVENLSTKGNYTDYDQEKLNDLNLTMSGYYLTNSKDIDNPQIGDMRISFVYNNTTDLSVLAVQQGSTFVDFVSKAGKRINRVMDGTHSGHEMVSIIIDENNFLKWLLRALGTILCMLGFGAILKPLSAVASFVPILGNIVGAAVELVAFILGLCVSLIVIAIAWIRFRPILGISLIVIVAILIAFLIIRGKKTKTKEA